MDSNLKRKIIQRSVGWSVFGILILMIILIQTVHYFGAVGAKKIDLITAIATGTILGYILSRGRFGFAGPIKKMVVNGDGRQARSLVLMMALSSIAGGAIMIAAGKTGSTTMNATTAAGFGSIIGGFIFGIGMMLGGGCASGTITSAGSGRASAFYVLLFFMFGGVAGTAIAAYTNKLDWFQFIPKGEGYYGDIAGPSGIWVAVLINLALFSLFLILIKFVEIRKNKKGTFALTKFKDEPPYTEEDGQKMYFKFWSKRTYYYLFEKRWGWFLTASLLAVWFLVYTIAWQSGPSIQSAYSKWAGWIFYAFGWHDIFNVTVNGENLWAAKSMAGGVLRQTDSLRNISVILGTLIFSLTAGIFKFANWKKWRWKEYVLYAVAGLLMGIGAKIANGCNVGAMWTGISSFSAYGWFFTIFLILGGILGAKFVIKVKHRC